MTDKQPYLIIEVTQIRSGQPRAYADTESVTRIKVRRFGYDGNELIPRDDAVLDYARRVLNLPGTLKEVRKDGDFGSYFNTYTDYLRICGPGLAEARTVSPYTD